MRNILILTIVTIIFSCSQKKELSEDQIKSEVKEAWSGLYQNYANSDMRFIDYYEDEVIRMGTDGEYKVGKQVFKESWEQYYNNNDVNVLDYSDRTILQSEDQTVTFNTYKELFIDKKTRDTTLVEGTWIAVWRKQKDGT